MARRSTSRGRRSSRSPWYHIDHWPEPARRVLSVTTGFLVLSGFMWWGIASGHMTRLGDALGFGMVQITAHAGFRIDDILVEGRHHTNPDVILAALNIKRGDPIFGFDPASARDTLEKLSWVEQVRVERHLPDLVRIYITERVPVALWQREGQLSLIDRHGQVLDTDNLKKFGDLPVLIGSTAPEQAENILQMLAFEPLIAPRVAAATLVGGRRWDLTLDNKIKVKLPEKDAARALHNLGTLQTEHQILDRDLLAIDMRIPEKMVIEASNPAEADSLNLQAGI